jgi:hypothetical protein
MARSHIKLWLGDLVISNRTSRHREEQDGEVSAFMIGDKCFAWWSNEQLRRLAERRQQEREAQDAEWSRMKGGAVNNAWAANDDNEMPGEFAEEKAPATVRPPRSVRLQLAFDDMATCGWAAPQTKPRKDSVLASREIARAAIRLRAPVKQLRIGFLQLAEFRLG